MNSILCTHIPNIKKILMKVKIDSHFIPVNDNIVKTILSYGDELKRSSPVKADHTRWQLHNTDRTFDYFIERFHEIYPTHRISEIWACVYRQGDYAEAHNHFGFDLGFAWFVDTCSSCTPLVFPDIDHPWLAKENDNVITPSNGMLYVFNGKDIHYVAPHICDHPRIVMAGNVSKAVYN